MQCIICTKNNINTVFINCGHMCYCIDCIKQFNPEKCPCCDKNIGFDESSQDKTKQNKTKSCCGK